MVNAELSTNSFGMNVLSEEDGVLATAGPVDISPKATGITA